MRLFWYVPLLSNIVRQMRESRSSYRNPAGKRPAKRVSRTKDKKVSDGSVRLNKYIANSGVCSRREADVLISSGAIMVNGKIVTELGTQVMPGDIVVYGKQRLKNEKKVYVLLNKPKDYITTTDDPQKRKTVLTLIGNAFKERLYPVGRLDRNTTGLLLLTNDGEMAKKLSHPSHKIKKLYHVYLNKKITKADLQRIAEGITIGEDKIIPDSIALVNKDKNNELGIEIHSGQNRIVRRIFEQLGYKVSKLDRVMYAGLTKKDLPRGKWRKLSEKEISYLSMLR